jgi:hypothetical protein
MSAATPIYNAFVADLKKMKATCFWQKATKQSMHVPIFYFVCARGAKDFCFESDVYLADGH